MIFANVKWPTNGLIYDRAYRQIIRFTERQTKDDATKKDGQKLETDRQIDKIKEDVDRLMDELTDRVSMTLFPRID